MSRKSDRGTSREKTIPTREPEGEPKREECGCVEQRYNDDTVDRMPCIGHAFGQMAESLAQASNSIGYAGASMLQAGAYRRKMEAMNDEVDEGIKDGSID